VGGSPDFSGSFTGAFAPVHGQPPFMVTMAGLAADGPSHKKIAQALGLAPATVRNHLARVYPVLGVHSRAQLLSRRAAARFADDAGA
jgi:hypothetical protein